MANPITAILTWMAERMADRYLSTEGVSDLDADDLDQVARYLSTRRICCCGESIYDPEHRCWCDGDHTTKGCDA